MAGANWDIGDGAPACPPIAEGSSESENTWAGLATQPDAPAATQEDVLGTQEDQFAGDDSDEDDSNEDPYDDNNENSGILRESADPGGLKRPRKQQPTMSRRAEVSWHNKLSRTISIDRLPQEGKRMNRTSLSRQPSEHGIDRRAISALLRPRTWAPSPDGSFPLTADDIIELCDIAQEMLERESNLLQLSAPIKVFGDIHGQYADLMRLFDQYGAPSRDSNLGGDINLVDYLFLGDYVDRGKHSLEVICLLVALKIQFPNRVFLVRGNHESPEVNARDGFLHECVQRLGGRTDGIAAWRRLNLLFEWMPMGALINGCILAVHGGIGQYLESPQQIAQMQRPLRMGGSYAELLLDLLWSDPTSSDDVMGVHINEERGAPVVCYGPDRVNTFLAQNNLSLILRAHECVMDGFQRFAGGQLITVFSATNYCNRWANAGAILEIGKDLEITPKMIYPLDELEDAWMDAPPGSSGAATSSDTAESDGSEDLRMGPMRPPTPPRACTDDWSRGDRDSLRVLESPAKCRAAAAASAAAIAAAAPSPKLQRPSVLSQDMPPPPPLEGHPAASGHGELASEGGGGGDGGSGSSSGRSSSGTECGGAHGILSERGAARLDTSGEAA